MIDYTGKKCIVRGKDAGVFFGEIIDIDGRNVDLKNARKLWHWSGANCCVDLANIGVTDPRGCKFTAFQSTMRVLDIAEIIPASEEAILCIERVPVWTQKK